MKKNLFVGLSLVLMGLIASCGSSKNAQQYSGVYPQQSQVVVPSQPKGGDPVEQMVKEYTADGFKSESMAFTMYESIATFRQKLISNSKLIEIISDGEGASSFSAEMQAQNAAAIKYATAAGSVIKGGMERDFGKVEGEAYDVFHGAYVQDVASFVMPLLEKNMKFIKKSGNSYIVRVGYILDEAKALQARSKAFDTALKKAGDGMTLGGGIRKYVNEDIKPDN